METGSQGFVIDIPEDVYERWLEITAPVGVDINDAMVVAIISALNQALSHRIIPVNNSPKQR